MISGIFYNDVQFFKFYKEGTFLNCLIAGCDDPIKKEQIEEIRQWFRREEISKDVSRRTYTFRDKKIVFSTPGHFGDGRLIDYEGEYKNNCLILDSLNHNTGQRIKGQVFVRC